MKSHKKYDKSQILWLCDLSQTLWFCHKLSDDKKIRKNLKKIFNIEKNDC